MGRNKQFDSISPAPAYCQKHIELYSDVYHKFERLSFGFNLGFLVGRYLFWFNITSASNEWEAANRTNMILINIDIAKKERVY